MVRQIIHIDEEKCNGCGACANACHEGAIAIINGKARLTREDYCDGMGDCLPHCPMEAITFEQREAAAYDEAAVEIHKREKMAAESVKAPAGTEQSQLQNWPVQIKLAPLQAPCFKNAHLLVAADCTAYAYAAFHQDFLQGRVALVGCTKLDGVDYSEKLTQIIRNNDIQSVTVARMIVPCCGGMETAVRKALQNSGKTLPCQVVTIHTDGSIMENKTE